MGLTVTELAEKLQTEADAYKYLEELRWPTGTPTCPHCANVGADYIEPTNGTSRRTRTGSLSQRRVWRCHSCRQQFSVLTGTPLHGTKISIRKWVFVIFEMCSSKNGVAAREIERKYDLCPRTAWHMLHRVREMTRRDPIAPPLSGTIVADETFIGGSLKNMHRSKVQAMAEPKQMIPGHHVAWPHLTTVLSLVNAESGEVRSAVVPDITGHTLRKVIADQVNMAGSVLYTDKGSGYRQLGREFIAHEVVDHEAGEYVRYTKRGKVSSNKTENFFLQLMRSLDGTHHHVSREHLFRYLAELDYRFTHRKISDAERTEQLVAAMPMRRLTYKVIKNR